MGAYGELIPVNVLTGSLGSGKTTLLGAALRAPRLSATLVLVNELGEIGLDHQLVEHAAESTLLLENGCLCCAMRDDLKSALAEMHSRRERGEIPPYERVVVETTGIADPAPIAYTLLAEPVLQHHYRLGNVITVVDAINAGSQLARFEESVKQVVLADRLVVSKLDLADSSALPALQRQLRAFNPTAPIAQIGSPQLDPVELFVCDVHDRELRGREVEHWLHSLHDAAPAGSVTGGGAHAEAIVAHCFTFDSMLDWTAFGVWMSMLLHRHGERVLRIKGLLNVAGVSGPVLVNGVQHLVHPPAHLDHWPDADRRSRLVIVVSGLERASIERSLNAFNAMGNPPSARIEVPARGEDVELLPNPYPRPEPSDTRASRARCRTAPAAEADRAATRAGTRESAGAGGRRR